MKTRGGNNTFFFVRALFAGEEIGEGLSTWCRAVAGAQLEPDLGRGGSIWAKVGLGTWCRAAGGGSPTMTRTHDGGANQPAVAAVIGGEGCEETGPKW